MGHGTVLAGRYRLEERLQVGADGSVWRAVDQTLERQVAVRVLRAKHPFAADVVDAARRAALVDDTRLARVLDVGEWSGLTYIVSEHVQGRSLADLLDRGPLPAETVRRIVGEAAQALDRAGARGLHHLRLTPSSIVVVPDGSIKLLGTAVEAASAGGEPENAAVANRADAVGLVCLIYAGLTARWPGLTDSPLGPAPRVTGRAVPPGELASGIPNDLDTLCTVTLGPHDDGPRSPGELALELSPWAHVAPLTDPRGLEMAPSRPAKALAVGAAAARGGTATALVEAETDAPDEGALETQLVAGGPERPSADGDTTVDIAAAEQDDEAVEETVAVPAGLAPSVPAAPGAPAAAAPPSAPVAPVAPETAPRGIPFETPAPVPAAAAPPVEAPLAAWSSVAPATPPSLALPTALAGHQPPSSANGAPWQSRVSDLQDGQHAWPTPLPAARAGVAPPITPPSGRGSTDLANEILGDPSPGMLRFDAAPPPPLAPASPASWSDALNGQGGGQDRLGPFLPSVPVGRPPKEQSRLVIVVLAALVVLGLVLAVVSFWDVFVKSSATTTTTPGARTSSSAPAPSPGASGGTSTSTSPAASQPVTGAPITITSIKAIDPQGDGSENGGQAPRAIDGSTATAWRSEGYQSPNFGGTGKSGLGLVLDLGQTVTVSSVLVDYRGTDGVVELRSATAPGLDSSSVVTSDVMVNSNPLTLRPPTPVKTRYLVLWFTKLTKQQSGEYRLSISEIVVR